MKNTQGIQKKAENEDKGNRDQMEQTESKQQDKPKPNHDCNHVKCKRSKYPIKNQR